MVFYTFMNLNLVTELGYSDTIIFMARKSLKMLHLYFAKVTNCFSKEASSSPLALRSVCEQHEAVRGDARLASSAASL